ncbi:MAG: NAD(P)-dependent alcohol dehydrogenase [Alphaproteobacteria bacterium]|nr:NAD(P)-dependent alcohol dehydrogenase [Alphaproteobacteria bacterium]
MKAIVYQQYGSPDQLKIVDVPKPTPKDGEVLLKIYATSLNASDVEFLHGKPVYTRFMGLFKPRKQILGSDVAGIIEAVGSNVKNLKIGDAVFGDIFMHFGGLAEYCCAPETLLMVKPENISFIQAAAMPQAAIVPLQGLQKHQTKPKQKVLINGAGGGAGSFAVQLAKSYGAIVTAVDSIDKQEFMCSLGADFTINYKQQDFARNGQHYDLILDLVASRSAAEIKPALSPNGNYVLVGGDVPTILSILIKGFFASLNSDKKIGMLMHNYNVEDLAHMCALFDTGEALPIIDQVYPLKDATKAFKKLISGHVKGKLVIQIST